MSELRFPPAARQFIDVLGIQYPVIGGPMYPCSNPELVAAVSAAGGLGVMQPISLTYVHGHEFRQGIRLMQKLTGKPIGMNALIEKSSKKYQQRMSQWIDVALERRLRRQVRATAARPARQDHRRASRQGREQLRSSLAGSLHHRPGGRTGPVVPGRLCFLRFPVGSMDPGGKLGAAGTGGGHRTFIQAIS